jgi:hypothetical protein
MLVVGAKALFHLMIKAKQQLQRSLLAKQKGKQ